MPVQINEVIIKTVIESNSAAGTASPAASTSAGSGTADTELAEMILEIIKEKNER